MSFIDGARIAVGLDLEGAGPRIAGDVELMADELNRLKHELTTVLEHGPWSGQAQAYYSGMQNEWNIAAEGLFGPNGALAQIAHAMHIVWQNYEEAEWANTITWRH